MTDRPFVIGVDGCPGGWVAIRLPYRGSARPVLLGGERWIDLPLDAAAMVAVDMPIGLAGKGRRVCDTAARRLLPAGRKSSVFPPPRRYMLPAGGWAEANALGKSRECVGLPRQSWGIAPKIRQIDDWISPALQQKVRETHPELVFLRLADGRALSPKRSREGRAERLGLLRAQGMEGLDVLLASRPRLVGADDVLDAAACALTARIMAAGWGRKLPDGPSPRDERGLRMEIWY